MMQPILVIGDSHVAAFRRAQDGIPSDLDKDIAIEPLGAGSGVLKPFFSVDEDTGEVSTHADGWRNRTFSKELLADENDATPLIALSLPINTSRILRDFGWHSHAPWQLCEGDELPLSDQAVERLIEQDSQYAVGFAEALKSVGLDVLVIEGPRFFEDAKYLDRNRFEVCQYIDALYRSTVQGKLATAEISVLQQPEETITDYGTTVVDYHVENPNDVHHANASYGRMMLDRLHAMVMDDAEKSRVYRRIST